jgi:hypothetical protein
VEKDEQQDPPEVEDNLFAKYAGTLPAFPGGIEEINAWLRDLRGHDD